MKTGARPAFTLIELMLVIAIIAVLMSLLLPAVGAVQRTVMTSSTRSRFSAISAAIDLYALSFDGAYPPSNGDTSWKYPFGRVGSIGYNPNRPCYSHTRGNLGAHNLVYFLMGPELFGWDMDIHGVKRQWIPPDSLRKWVTPSVIGVVDGNADPASEMFYAFQDAWGVDSTRYNLTGSIHYSLVNPRTQTANRHDLSSAYYWGGTRDYESGDGPYLHTDRLLRSRGSSKYILVSSGPDRKLGYYIWDKSLGRQRADSVSGSSDDIANIPVN